MTLSAATALPFSLKIQFQMLLNSARACGARRCAMLYAGALVGELCATLPFDALGQCAHGFPSDFHAFAAANRGSCDINGGENLRAATFSIDPKPLPPARHPRRAQTGRSRWPVGQNLAAREEGLSACRIRSALRSLDQPEGRLSPALATVILISETIDPNHFAAHHCGRNDGRPSADRRSCARLCPQSCGGVASR